MTLALLRRVFSVVLSRAGSRVAGFVVLLAIIWFAGPYVGLKTVAARLIVMGIILALVAVVWLVAMWLVRVRGRRLGKALSESKGGANDLELEALNEKFKDAVASIKASDLGIKYRGSAALYALPWYMIIGPSAAGKSTLLRNSGLHFPYAHQSDTHIQGIGGTRNCDWWFSDEAVILDTAGRYTTESEDREEWTSFLTLLAKYRRRRPINGVIVALSTEDILTADDNALEQHVNIIRERLSELTRNLGLVFPVYVVFTKVDLLSGFESFFGELDVPGREQVWGVALKPSEDAEVVAAEFEDKMNAMITRIGDLRLHKMSMQRRAEMKWELFDFPSQFRAASERAVDFVSLLVKSNPYQDSPNFAGVYFTSGTQEGTPLQRIIGSLRQAFGYRDGAVPAPAANGIKPYFIRNLFAQVIFPNANAVGRTRKGVLINRGLKSAAVTAGFVAVVAVTLGLIAAFGVNGVLVNNLGKSATEFATVITDSNSDAGKRAVALQKLSDRYAALQNHESTSIWFMRFGGYFNKRILGPVEDEIVAYLEPALLNPLGLHLEEALRAKHVQWAGADDAAREAIRSEYYNDLKYYLMLGDPSEINPDDLREAMADFVVHSNILPSGDDALSNGPDSNLKRRAAVLADIYVRHMLLPTSDARTARHWKTDDDVIRAAREQLRTDPVPAELYAQMVDRGHSVVGYLTVGKLLGDRYGSLVWSQKKLPAMYTKKGMNDYFLPELDKVVSAVTKGDWVLDGKAAIENKGNDKENAKLAQTLNRQIKQLYFRDYRQAWFDFLGSFRVSRFYTVRNAAQQLLMLARKDGPLVKLASVAADNLAIPEFSPGIIKNVAAKADRMSGAQVHDNDQAMADFRRVVAPAEGQPVSERMSQYLTLLTTIQGEMEALSAASDPSRDSRKYATKLLSGQGIDSEIFKAWVTVSSLLGGIDVSVKTAVEPLFREPIRAAWRAVIDQASHDVDNDWNTIVLQPYTHRLKGSFPFEHNGSDAALADVEDFFRPDSGTLWGFVHSDLNAFVEQDDGQWEARQWLGVGFSFSPEFLASLKEADNISNALFSRGSDHASVTYYVYPIPSSGLSETLLESNGASYRYRNEPQEWRQFKWPGDGNSLGARVEGISMSGAQQADLSADGVWGLFRLVSEANLSRIGGNEYIAEWKMKSSGGKRINVKFELRADRKANIFGTGLLHGFHIPDSPFVQTNKATKGKG